MLLHRHQVEAIEAGRRGQNYVLTTGPGREEPDVPDSDCRPRAAEWRKEGIQAVVVYPMNALCNSQYGELEKFLRVGFGLGKEPVRFYRYTGQESREQRDRIIQNPPDILLTNYVMLELLLTRPVPTPPGERRSRSPLPRAQRSPAHVTRVTAREADVALLVRRLRVACRAE